MFYVYGVKFDVMENLVKFWVLERMAMDGGERMLMLRAPLFGPVDARWGRAAVRCPPACRLAFSCCRDAPHQRFAFVKPWLV